MKSTYLTLLLAFVLMGTNQAQSGIRAGINTTNFYFDGESFLETQIGFHLGATYDIDLSSKLMLRPGVLYSTKGAGKETPYDLSYVEVPFNLIYNLGNLKSGVFVQAGTHVALLMSAKSGETDLKRFTNKSDYGLNLGLGYRFNPNVSFGVDYQLGLARLDVSADEVSVKNKNLSAYLIYEL